MATPPYGHPIWPPRSWTLGKPVAGAGAGLVHHDSSRLDKAVDRRVEVLAVPSRHSPSELRANDQSPARSRCRTITLATRSTAASLVLASTTMARSASASPRRRFRSLLELASTSTTAARVRVDTPITTA